MSNAIVVPDSFNAPVASVFKGVQAADDLSGGITGGYGLLKYRGKVWSIQYQGNSVNLMRDDGDGPRGSVDVVILKANAQLSKTFYENGWDENNNAPPDCASANGIVPDAGVPKKQSHACATCPKNAWGSAPNGGKGKACGDHRRMAITPLTDLKNEHFGGPLLLRCPAASLQDLAAFNARYHQMGYPYFSMGIKIAFDPQESFPKFQFTAIRPLTEAEAAVVVAMRDSPDVARVVSEGTAPVAAQVAHQPAAFSEPIPATAVQPQQVSPPAVVAAPVAAQPQPQPAAQPVAAPAVGAGGVGPSPAAAPAGPNGAGTGFGPVANAPAAQPVAAPVAAPVQHSGFGPTAGAGSPQPAPAVAAQPAVAPATVPAKPPVAMTGFGAVAPEVIPPAAAPAGPAPAPAAPAVVTAFEGSIDDRLNALVNGQI